MVKLSVVSVRRYALDIKEILSRLNTRSRYTLDIILYK